DAEKCARADFVIPSHRGWLAMLAGLRRAVRRTLEQPARHWPPNPHTAPPRPVRTAAVRRPAARGRHA
ncbi:MAG: dephospho-CoA kinase, partial [Rhodospirillaceae bacterium]|nr:dephospho-CoA kinase [Rhodospirillaceae bacterium]